MPGQIRKLIDNILEKRSKGNPILMNTTKTKLMLKGINPDKYTNTSPDDTVILTKLKTIAKDLGIQV